MVHSELFFGFPGGQETIIGKKNFARGITIQNQSDYLIKMAYSPSVFMFLHVDNSPTFSVKRSDGVSLFSVNNGGATSIAGSLNTTSAGINNIGAPFITGNASTNIWIGNSGSITSAPNSIHTILGVSPVARIVLGGTGVATLAIGSLYAGILFSETLVTTGASGAQPLIAQVAIKPSTITISGSSTVTDTATLYIENASSASVTGKNYALWVDAGIVRIDDNVSAPSTSVGVAITNYYGSAATNFLGDPNLWLRVNVGGTDYKIPLYT
jgi:hypothetical protein